MQESTIDLIPNFFSLFYDLKDEIDTFEEIENLNFFVSSLLIAFS